MDVVVARGSESVMSAVIWQQLKQQSDGFRAQGLSNGLAPIDPGNFTSVCRYCKAPTGSPFGWMLTRIDRV